MNYSEVIGCGTANSLLKKETVCGIATAVKKRYSEDVDAENFTVFVLSLLTPTLTFEVANLEAPYIIISAQKF